MREAPEGKPSKAPQSRAFPQGWNIPTPDAVFEMPAPQGVRPGERSVVRHAIVVIKAPGRDREEYPGGYAPGRMAQIGKSGEARLVKAGSLLTFQMHYAANRKATSDRTPASAASAQEHP